MFGFLLLTTRVVLSLSAILEHKFPILFLQYIDIFYCTFHFISSFTTNTNMMSRLIIWLLNIKYLASLSTSVPPAR